MALWRCKKCSTLFAVGLPHCPQCTSTSVEMEDEDMSPKTTTHGGSSNAEGDAAWDGNSSPESTEPQQTTEQKSEDGDQPPAPTTEPPSTPAQTESSTAPSTDGETADPYDGWLKEDLVAELADRNLPVSGTKAELLARLRENDAAPADDTADETGE